MWFSFIVFISWRSLSLWCCKCFYLVTDTAFWDSITGMFFNEFSVRGFWYTPFFVFVYMFSHCTSAALAEGADLMHDQLRLSRVLLHLSNIMVVNGETLFLVSLSCKNEIKNMSFAQREIQHLKITSMCSPLSLSLSVWALPLAHYFCSFATK